MICPDCDGAGKNEAIADPGCRLVVIACAFCNATGAVTEVQMGWRRIGQTHRRERIDRRESIMECATRLDVGPAAVSSFERGLIDPAQFPAKTSEAK